MSAVAYPVSPNQSAWREPSVLPGFGPALGFTLFYLSAVVLLPLAEIEPDMSLPGLPSVSQLLARVDRSGVEKLDVA